MLKKKGNYKLLIGVIVGLLLSSTFVYAATTVASSKVLYDNSNSRLTSTNVQDAIDELSTKAKKLTTSHYMEKGEDFYPIIPTTTTSIVFTDTTPTLSVDSSLTTASSTALIDVSDAKDESVVAWMSGTVLYVSSRSTGKKVLANENSSFLFYCGSDYNPVGGSASTMFDDLNQPTGFFDTNLKTIDITNLDTSRSTNMQAMFAGREGLTTITGAEYMDTSNVTDMSYMFQHCYALTSVDVSNFDTSKVVSMRAMWCMCKAMGDTRDFSNWDTSSVVYMERMFCTNQATTVYDLTSFDVSSVQSATAMFNENSSLTTIYASDWTGNSNIVSAANMFAKDTNLVGGISFSSSKVTGAYAKITGGYFTQKS